MYDYSVIRRYGDCECCSIPWRAVVVDRSREYLCRFLVSVRESEPGNTKDQQDNHYEKLSSAFHLIRMTLSDVWMFRFCDLHPIDSMLLNYSLVINVRNAFTTSGSKCFPDCSLM